MPCDARETIRHIELEAEFEESRLDMLQRRKSIQIDRQSANNYSKCFSLLVPLNFKMNGGPSNARFKKLSSSCGVKNHSIHDLPGNRDRPPFGVLSRRSWERPDAMRTKSWIPSTWSMNLRESWLLLVILLCFASVKFWFVFRPVRWHHHPNVVDSHLSCTNLHGWNGLKNSTSDRSNSHGVHRLPPGLSGT